MDDLTSWWVSGHRLNLVQRISDPHSHLHGESKLRGGKPVITSSIIKTEWVDGFVVATTRSGRRYRLVTPEPAYWEWLAEEQAENPTT